MCGSVKGTLCVWSTPSESIVDKKGYIVESVDISPDGQRAIVSGGSSGHAENIVLYDLNGLSILNSWSGHSDFVNHVILFPDGKKVISASWDKTVRIWNSIDGHELKRLEGPFNWESIALARDGGTVLTGANGYTRLWDCATGKLIRLFEGDYYVRSVAYSPDGKIAAGGCYYDGTVRIWDAGSGKEKERLRGHTGEVASVSFSFDSRLLATGTVVQENDSNNPSDGQVHIWDMADGKEIHRYGAGEGGINKLIFSPDGKTVLGASRNMVRVWDTTNGKELRRFVPLGDGPINSLACSTNGRVIVGSYTGEVAIFELIGSVLPKDPPSSQQAFEELDRLVGFRLMREGPDQGQIVSLKRLSEKEMLPITLATQGLNDKDVFVRIRSARELHRRGAYSEPALPQVQKALQDEDARVRLLCVGILGHLGPKAASAVFELAKRLNDTDYSIRCEAAKALGEIGERAVQVVPALAQALEEEEFVNDEHFARSLSRASAEALGRIGKPAAASVPALVQAFRSRKDDHFRSSYVRALGEIGEAARAAVPDLVEALMSDDVNLRQAVAIALVNMKCDASYRPRIEAALARETYTDVQLSLKQLLRSM
jgi:WD40 repeat protein